MVAGTSSLASLPVALPRKPLSSNVNAKEIAQQFTDIFSKLSDASIFTADAVWRDCFALTGTLRTFYSAQGIVKAWQQAQIHSASIVENQLTIMPGAAHVVSLPNGSSWVDVLGMFRVRMNAGLVGKCTLMLGVVPGETESSWKIWSMRTVLEDIEGWPSVNAYEPKAQGVDGRVRVNGNFSDDDTACRSAYFDAVVVGGGQAGLSVAGRLSALNVSYVLIDKYKTVGDSWAARYDSARLHTIREYSHLPFDRTFPIGQYQEFLTKDDLARGYRDWTEKFGIDDHIWTETELKSGMWDDTSRQWTLDIQRTGHGEQLKCRFVVLASGAGGQVAYMPDLPGRDQFTGAVIHSQDYTSPKAWTGKRGIVVGVANTAHDIADDMYEAGLASTTMIQRSTTYVMPYEYWQRLSSRTYNENFPTELADKLQMTGPSAVGRLMVKPALDAMARQEPERFDALARAGFLTERYGDIFWHLFERAGGHYMDVGTSKKIADGKIGIKSGVTATHYTRTGLGFDDGTELAADVIVWATGFERNVKDSIARFFGQQVADQHGDFWGLDDEGEIKGAWKLNHPGLISHGMALGQARFMSKYIALQIKAALEGKPFEPYRDIPSRVQ